MTQDFATTLRRAMEKTRAADPAAATAIIQSALSHLPAGRAMPTLATKAPPQMRSAPLPRNLVDGASSLARRFADGPLAEFMRSGCAPCAGGGLDLGLKMPARHATPPVPAGASYSTQVIGRRDCRVFVPSERPGGPVGLVVMLHGCTQTPDDFALGTAMNLAAERAGYVVVYPAQTAAHNMQSCWNWFRPEDQRRDGGEPAELAAIARHVAAAEGVASGRIFVAGLSAGGAMAAVLAETHPDVFAAAGIHSGLPVGSAHDVPSAFAAMRGAGGGRVPAAPLIVFHGAADATVAPACGSRLVPGDGIETRHGADGRTWTRFVATSGSELWMVAGAGHAWCGGDPRGSYADPAGPAASTEMLRFFGTVATAH